MVKRRSLAEERRGDELSSPAPRDALSRPGWSQAEEWAEEAEEAEGGRSAAPPDVKVFFWIICSIFSDYLNLNPPKRG